MASFNFRMPSIRSAAGVMAIGVVITSVIVAVFRPLAGWVALVPEAVTSGFVWQVVTYGFVEGTPMGVIFGALILWNLGGLLEYEWGRKRFLWFSLGVVSAAGVATVLLSLVVPSLVRTVYPGGMVLTGSLWLAYGLHVGHRQTNFWGAAVTGNMLALIGAGFVFLNAAFSGLSTVIPDAFGLLFAFAYMRGARPGDLLIRYRSWKLDREFKKRSAHLKSLEGGKGNMGRDSDKFLH